MSRPYIVYIYTLRSARAPVCVSLILSVVRVDRCAVPRVKAAQSFPGPGILYNIFSREKERIKKKGGGGNKQSYENKMAAIVLNIIIIIHALSLCDVNIHLKYNNDQL